MKFRMIGGIVLALFLATICLPGISSVDAAPKSLRGHWTATDPNDGSTVHLVISGKSDPYKLFGFDAYAPEACPATSGLGTLKGTLEVDGNNLTKTVVAACPSEGITYPQAVLPMTYDPVTDTIYDPVFNLLYSR